MDKLIADRLKKRGMSWTRKGADRMARLISLRETGELDPWIEYRGMPRLTPMKEGITPDEGRCQGKDDDAWLNARLPALYGPHSGRPWAQVLRALAHGGTKD